MTVEISPTSTHELCGPCHSCGKETTFHLWFRREERRPREPMHKYELLFWGSRVSLCEPCAEVLREGLNERKEGGK